MVYAEYHRFEWDAAKAERNKLKHGISFERVAEAFSDPHAHIEFDGRHSAAEARFRLIGALDGEVLVVVFTMRRSQQTVRIISARLASRRERRRYGQNKGV